MVSVDNATIFQRNISCIYGAVRVVICHQQNVFDVFVAVENVICAVEVVVWNLVVNIEGVNRTACGCRTNVLNPSLLCLIEDQDGGRLRIGEKMLLSILQSSDSPCCYGCSWRATDRLSARAIGCAC